MVMSQPAQGSCICIHDRYLYLFCKPSSVHARRCSIPGPGRVCQPLATMFCYVNFKHPFWFCCSVRRRPLAGAGAHDLERLMIPYAHNLARLSRLTRTVRQAKRAQAITRCCWHRAVILNRIQEAVELDLVRVGVTLQEEIEKRIRHVSRLCAITTNTVRTMVLVQQHALGTGNLQALIKAIYGLTATVDVALTTRSRAHEHHDTVVIRNRFERRIYQSITDCKNLDGLLAKQTPSHVEVVNGHVAEYAPRRFQVGPCGQRRITTRDDDLSNHPDFTIVDCTTQAQIVGVESAVECQHHPAIQAFKLIDSSLRALVIHIDWLFADNWLAEPHSLQHQFDMEFGGSADEYSIDVSTLNGRCIVVGCLAT
ncbi:Uncharacterized protein ALO54_05727 [Pseudomonas syringae pv. philadelphi]|nr:Uncharacterized protein ALO86_05813 [Pseudomonas syringae pv. berberidis]KPY20146.1 Uncharacterized protein ALO54_05727 [Pseudomonas syringae pv. philadelphi]RMM17450.1 hypothetical protein ALQ83_05436 [Pseudomonas syringae pv. berberidis]RMP66925.1 hypothetical protein ALQ19_05731 [Pseudomonas syringae pv. berberidis]RMQ38422.1 hypothetical protein ALQ06_05803 [Pseudomonas syringae pv. berberidis]